MDFGSGPSGGEGAASKITDGPGQPCYIDRLPLELLSSIFALVTQEQRLLDARSFRAETSPAGVLCRVSKFWRTTAFCTPELWTTIVMDGPQTIERAEAWVDHSKSALLSMVIQPDLQEFFLPALEILDLYHHRVCELRIDVTPRNGRDVPLHFLPNLPRLVSLELNRSSIIGFWNLRQLLSNALQLRRLHFGGSFLVLGPGPEDTSRKLIMKNLKELVIPVQTVGHEFFAAIRTPALERVKILHPYLSSSTLNNLVFRPPSPGPDRTHFRASTELHVLLCHLPQIQSLTVQQTSVAWTFVILLGSPVNTMTNRWVEVVDPKLLNGFPLPRLRFLRFEDCAGWCGRDGSYVGPPDGMMGLLPRYQGVFRGRQYSLPKPLERIEFTGNMGIPPGLQDLREVAEPMGTVVVVDLEPMPQSMYA